MVFITSIETGRVDFTIVYGESLVLLGIGAGIVGVNFEVG